MNVGLRRSYTYKGENVLLACLQQNRDWLVTYKYIYCSMIFYISNTVHIQYCIIMRLVIACVHEDVGICAIQTCYESSLHNNTGYK